ncbi:flagellar basal body rod protein FlgC [Salinisphaera sp.]|uniref:flagellar basal body rod protein FlgC n=1 Tax=Salinisphaera sp. TaxID=1914330 RepID=UPI000C38E5B2|nr:flagellar basal body rod protein FlgC [Salinisphaera sp.]MBS64187.1 flagellar basal body rod protein FlgC [Salinisphaera sp.]
MSISNLFNTAGSALTAQAQRMNVAASNMANADSVAGPNGEPYRAKQVMFELNAGSAEGIGGVRVSNVIESDAPFRQEYNPGHALADDKGYVEMPNVNPTDEMINMISSSRSYQANIEVLNTGKELALRTLSLGE